MLTAISEFKRGKNRSENVKNERSKQLHHLSEMKKKAFYEQNRGTEVNVLFESDNSKGWMHGFSENYIRVKTKYLNSLANQLRNVILNETDSDGMYVYRQQ